MPQQPRVGQNTSNALRSYNRIIGNVSTQCDRFKELGNVAGKPLTMAVIYTTRDGMIQCLGSKKWADIVMDTCSEQLVESLAIQEESANEITTRAGLLRLPKPVSQLNSKTLQNIIPMAMKNLQGGGYIKWGHQSAKPEWWPVDVVFANVKQRPAEQSDVLDVPWVECLRKVLRAMFAHHGYDAETFVGDNPNDDSTNETDNSNNEDGANRVEERANSVEDGHNYAEDVAYDIEGVGISNGCGGGDAVRIEDGDDANVEDQCESVDLQRFSVGHMEAVSQDPSDNVHHFNINCNNYVEPRTSTPVSNFTARRILGSIQNTPERDNAVHMSPAKTGNTCMLQDTPKLPRYISEKKNWGRRENDPAVKDFLANHESPRKKRKLKPRNVFTPSSYD